MMENIAVILAGGSGKRLGSAVPKQFLEIAGRPVLEHTLKKFDSTDAITQLCVVVHPDHTDDASRIIKNARLSKPCILLSGGKERYDSSLAAITYFSERHNDAVVNLIFHDAVRPAVSCKTIADIISRLETHQAACVAVPSTDTLLRADSNGNIAEIPDRAVMWNAQTPQGFRLEVIARAYKIALKDPCFTTTDDCGVVLHYTPDVKISIVEGSPRNIKLTYASDLDSMALLLSQEQTGEYKPSLSKKMTM